MDDDDPTPEELEQLARSIVATGSLRQRHRQIVAETLRRLADIAAAQRRHPASGGRGTEP